MSVDHEYINNLLNIAEKCTGHSGKLSSLQSWAIGELLRVNAEIKDEAVKNVEAERIAEADQKATGLPTEEELGHRHEDDPEHEVLDEPQPTIADRRI